MSGNKVLNGIWLLLIGIGIIAGLYTAYRVFSEGHVIYVANDIIFWTLPLASYIFFALTSTGLAFVASASIVFGIKKYDAISKRATFLALAAIIGAFLSLILELGTPWNMINYLTTPNPLSTLWWMGLLYGFYLLFLLITFLKLHKGENAKIPGLLMFLFGLAATPTLGATIGLTESRAAFFGAFMPASFLLTALLSGIAAIILVTVVKNMLSNKEMSSSQVSLFDELGKVFGLIIGMVLFLFIWRTIIGLYASSPGFGSFDYIIRSFPYHFELWLGLLLPFIIMVVPSLRENAKMMAIASALVLMGMFSSRMELLLEGQATPLGPRAIGQPEFVFYFPNTPELLVVVFSFSVILLVYTIGEKYLNLEGSAG